MSIKLLETLKTIERDIMRGAQRNGICSHIYSLHDYETGKLLKSKFRELCTSWPHYSGDLYFPVPSDIDNESPAHCYTYHQCNGTLHQGKQLEYRLELLEFCIKELEKNENI